MMISVATPGWAALGGRLRQLAYQIPKLGDALLAHTIEQIITPALKDEAPVGQDQTDWQGNVTHKGGALRDSLTGTVQVVGGQVVIGFAAPDYARFVIEGTAAHEIYPSSRQALAFLAGGQVVVTRHVEHPGTQANPFEERAYERALPAIRGVLTQAGRNLFVGFGRAA